MRVVNRLEGQGFCDWLIGNPAFILARVARKRADARSGFRSSPANQCGGIWENF